MKPRPLTLLMLVLCLAALASSLGVIAQQGEGGPVQQLVAPLQAHSNVELLGRVGDPAYAAAVQGEYAYVGVGSRLMVLRISGGAITFAGQTGELTGTVLGVALAGDYAYVAEFEQRSARH